MTLASSITYLKVSQACNIFAFNYYVQALPAQVSSHVTIGTSLTFSGVSTAKSMVVFFKLNNVEYSAQGTFMGTHKLSYSFSDTVRFEFDGSTKTLSMYTNGVQTDLSTITDLDIWCNCGNNVLFV